MADTTVFDWQIDTLSCYPTYDNFQNVVFSVYYTYKATRLVGDKTYNASLYGSTPVSTNNITSFVPYDQLTKEIVVGWITPNLDVPQLQANLNGQIDNQINPPVVNLPPPWGNEQKA